MDESHAPERPRNVFEQEHHPASISGARYRWYRLVFHHDASDERNFDLWLNPIFADLAKPDAKSSGNAGISTVTRVGFRTANLDGGDTLLIDNLILAENWNDVVAAPNAVPEPGSLALAGLALLGLGLARRRRS